MATYPISPNDVCELTVKSLLAGQVIMWLHHLRFDGTTAIPDGRTELSSVLTQVQAAVGYLPKLKSLQTSDVAYQELRGQIVFPVRRPYTAVDLRPAVGTLAPPTMPPNAGMFINKQSSLVGRGRHGGWHICGMPVTASANGLIDPGTIALGNIAGVAWEATITTAAGNPWKPIIFNPRNPQTNVEIFSIFTEPTSRVEKRRTVGLGI